MAIIKKIFCCLSLLFATLFIGIGYAEISKEFEIKGLVSGDLAQTVFITNVTIVNENNASLVGRAYTGTVLTSNYSFKPVNNNSNVVLEVTFYNGSGLIYEFAGEKVQTHSNNNLIYQINDILIGQTVDPHTYVTLEFAVSSSTSGDLLSVVNFNFVVSNTEDNVGMGNHASLADDMVNNPTHGLNNPDSYLNEQIASRNKGSLFIPSRDTLGSMAITQGNSLESMFGDSYATNEKIAFVIQFIDTNNDDVIDYYYLFTTSVVLGANGSPNIAIGNPISPVYRTKISYNVEDSLWETEEILEGYANSAYYEESQPNFTINRTKIPSFDPDTWKQGRVGNSFSDAAWTTVNQTYLLCSTADSNTDFRYYKVTIPANTSYTFYVDGDNETDENNVLIEIYNSSQTKISSSYASNTFPTANSAQTYYIRISGSKTIDFKFIKN